MVEPPRVLGEQGHLNSVCAPAQLPALERHRGGMLRAPGFELEQREAVVRSAVVGSCIHAVLPRLRLSCSLVGGAAHVSCQLGACRRGARAARSTQGGGHAEQEDSEYSTASGDAGGPACPETPGNGRCVPGERPGRCLAALRHADCMQEGTAVGQSTAHVSVRDHPPRAEAHAQHAPREAQGLHLRCGGPRGSVQQKFCVCSSDPPAPTRSSPGR